MKHKILCCKQYYGFITVEAPEGTSDRDVQELALEAYNEDESVFAPDPETGEPEFSAFPWCVTREEES